jgi:ribose 5-phosphate isomerase B
MVIAVAADHAGFPLKNEAIEVARALGHEVVDLGTNSTDPVDYPDFAQAAGDAVRSGRAERAILLCGSGIGACVAANKLHGVRAGTCHDTFSAHQGVEDDDMNVMCLGARIIGPSLLPELVRSYLGAKFSGAERHVRRLKKVEALEHAEEPHGSQQA